MMNLSNEYTDEQCREAISYIDDQITTHRKAGLWDTADEYDCVLSMLNMLQDLIEEGGFEGDSNERTNKMTKSEAMDKLRELSRHSDTSKYFPLLAAARDLLTAEEDLPYALIFRARVVARFHSKAEADRFQACYTPGELPVITGPPQPVDHDEDEPTESKGCPGCGGLTEWDLEDPPNPYYCDDCIPPDDIPAFEGDPDDCAFKRTPRLVPVTEQIVEVDGKYYKVEP